MKPPTSRWRPSSVSLSAWPSRNPVTSAATAWARSARAPLRSTSVSGVGKRAWLGKLKNITVGHGVSLLQWRNGGANTFTIRRLTLSCRHQFLRIARAAVDGAGIIIIVTGGNAQAMVARSLAPLLQDGQVI